MDSPAPLLSYLAGVLWQGFLLLCLIWIADRLSPNVRAAIKARVWLVALLLVPLLPLLSALPGRIAPTQPIVQPPFSITVPAWFSTAPISTQQTAPSLPSHPPSSTDPSLSPAIVYSFYGFGILLASVPLILALHRLHRATRSAKPITDPAILDGFEAAASSVGLDAPCFLMTSPTVKAPISLGVFHYRILLPKSIGAELDPAEMRDLLLHEATHIRRLDPPALFLLALLRSFFFFHPLYWIGFKRYATLAEHAADSAVVSTTREPVSYTSFLVKMAERCLHQEPNLAPGILRRKSELLRRAELLLANRRSHASGFRGIPFGIISFLAVGIAWSCPLEKGPDTYHHSNKDPRSSFTEQPLEKRAAPEKNLQTLQAWFHGDKQPASDASPDELSTRLVRKELGLQLPVELLEYGHTFSEADQEKATFLRGIDAAERPFVLAVDRRYTHPNAGQLIWGSPSLDGRGERLAFGSERENAAYRLLQSWVADRLNPNQQALLFAPSTDFWQFATGQGDAADLMVGVTDFLNTARNLSQTHR
ncbi:MAG: M56 family metallopeptidase [Puniceicoccaceae bacterium]